MRLSQPNPAELLDRYWDGLAAGSAIDASELDPALVAAVRELHARDDAPAPDSAFLMRLRKAIERAPAEDLGEIHRLEPVFTHVRTGAQGTELGGDSDLQFGSGRRTTVGLPRLPRGLWRGTRLAAAALLIVLLITLVALGGLAIRDMANRGAHPAGQPSPTAAPSGTAPIDQIVATLRPAGLVFEINQTIDVVGRQKITLLRLAADRDVTYVVYTTSDGQPAAADFAPLAAGRPLERYTDGFTFGADGMPSASPIEQWAAYSGISPDAREVQLRFLPTLPPPSWTPGTASIPVDQVVRPAGLTILVDLSGLRNLPAPERPQASVTVNGVKVDAVRLTRGLAVSTLELSASVVDANALVPVDVTGPADDATIREQIRTSVTATVDRRPVTVVGETGRARDGVASQSIRLLGLPEGGTLRVTLNRVSIDFTAGRQVAVARGPFELAIGLGAGPAGGQ